MELWVTVEEAKPGTMSYKRKVYVLFQVSTTDNCRNKSYVLEVLMENGYTE